MDRNHYEIQVLHYTLVVGPIGIATPALAQNMTVDNATMMGRKMTASNKTGGSTGSSDYTPK